MRGNVVDLAVGIMIGAAFGKIIRRSSATSSCHPSDSCSGG
jgi:large-conductance mechanosensitive channel